MPTAPEILAGLQMLSRSWVPLAIAWHLALAGMMIGLALRWRPSLAALGLLLALPLASVSVLAFTGANPFNGAVFAALAAASVATTISRKEQTGPAPKGWQLAGWVTAGFGWIYPHFLEDPWMYVVAAPLGIIPCPTLAAVIGISMLRAGRDAPVHALLLSAAGLFYGLFGVLRLGVAIDVVLAVSAAILAFAAWQGMARQASLRG